MYEGINERVPVIQPVPHDKRITKAFSPGFGPCICKYCAELPFNLPKHEPTGRAD